LIQHPDVRRVFPPIPLNSAVVIWDKGTNHLGGTLIPQGANGLCVVNSTGIWWMSDVSGDVPWPSPYDTTNPPAPVPPNSAGGPENPRSEEMRLILSYTEMLFATDGTLVQSIQPAQNSPITVQNVAGKSASTGNLFLGLDLAFLANPTPVEGDTAFKRLENQTFRQGYIVEGLVAGANVNLTSTRQTNIGTAQAPSLLYQGRVTIDVASNLAERELLPQIVKLYDAREHYVDALNVLYYLLPTPRTSYLRCAFYVPSLGLPANPQVHLRAVLLGSSTGTLPALTVSLKRLPRPVAGPVNIATPVEQALTFNSNQAITANQYLEINSTAVTVLPSDTVLLTLQRNAADGYSGDVGVLRVALVVDSGH
jgi:hypothetical protein